MDGFAAGTNGPACRTCLTAGSRVEVCSVPIDVVDINDVLGHFGDFLACGESHVVHQVSVDPLNRARSRHGGCDPLVHASINVPDGVGVTWALSRLHGIRLSRTPGTELLKAALLWGSDRQIRHAFVGSTPQTLTALRAAVASHAPAAIVSDLVSPPFGDISSARVAEDIRLLGERPDILWVGLGTPLQQEWAMHAGQLQAAPIIATIGAAFDFMAQTRSRGPALLRDHGFEWLNRLAAEPARLWRRYLVGNPQFVLAVERERRAMRS